MEVTRDGRRGLSKGAIKEAKMLGRKAVIRAILAVDETTLWPDGIGWAADFVVSAVER